MPASTWYRHAKHRQETDEDGNRIPGPSASMEDPDSDGHGEAGEHDAHMEINEAVFLLLFNRLYLSDIYTFRAYHPA